MGVQIVSFVNHKGGVGKTTSAVNIGAGLNLLGKKVLLVDLDPQANLTDHLGLSPEEEKTIYGAMKGQYPLPVVQIKEGLDVTPSTLDLAGAEIELSSKIGREIILKKLLGTVSGRYDYVLIDCPPSLGLLTVNGLTASDMAIITAEPGKFSMLGMKRLIEVFGTVQEFLSKELKAYRILVTKYDTRQSLPKQFTELISETYRGKVYKTVIRSTVSLSDAQMQGKSVFDTAAKSKGAEDYLSVCYEIMNDALIL
jgi:chromosome partitioning protein